MSNINQTSGLRISNSSNRMLPELGGQALFGLTIIFIGPSIRSKESPEVPVTGCGLKSSFETELGDLNICMFSSV